MAEALQEKPVTPTQKAASPSFAQRRWFTLLGLGPLAIYVVVHLLSVAGWWSGPDGYDATIAASHGSWLPWLGTALLVTFIGYHAWVGIQLMLKARPLSPAPQHRAHWQYILQRVSAAGILLFIPAHIYKVKLAPALAGTYESFAGMHEAFAVAPERFLTVPVYLLGTAGVAYHLANGLWTATVTLGLAQSAAAQKRVQVVSFFFFVFLMVLAYGSIAVIIRG